MSYFTAAMRGATSGVSRLRVARTLRGMTQHELEQLAGIAPTTVSHYEAGRRVPLPATQERLADALDIAVDELFPA